MSYRSQYEKKKKTMAEFSSKTLVNICQITQHVPQNGYLPAIKSVSAVLVIYLLTYLLTPWSRVLLEKLTGSAASQEIPRIFGTQRFITVLTSARHLSLS